MGYFTIYRLFPILKKSDEADSKNLFNPFYLIVMKAKKNRVVITITQYTLYGEPEILNVKNVLDKIAKKEAARLKRKPREKKQKNREKL